MLLFERDTGVGGIEGAAGMKPGGSCPSGKTIGTELLVAGVPEGYPRKFVFGGGVDLSAGSGIGRSASAGLRKFKPV